eukprot:TRINITY_DN11600_c0_g3_i2.p1 TRINITY_DN11600_c0_g3~~TRINITY_DN11600_c0_g3_i2.p1  ORF type:complete len:1289 (-),score=306.34 TRINITY_DN11600_c0_g3_i2:346-4212(-)
MGSASSSSIASEWESESEMPGDRTTWSEMARPLIVAEENPIAETDAPRRPSGPALDDQPPRKFRAPARAPAKDHAGKPLYADNSIRTAKYSWWNFVPLNLYSQFHKLANWYFLVLSVIVCFPAVSPFAKPYTTIAPFAFVLFLNMVKDGYVDYQRHQDDNKLNRNITSVLRGGEFTPLKWRDIHVGEVVMVKEGESVPVDLLILATDMRNTGDAEVPSEAIGGLCYVDTAELDGETNLKLFQGLAETAKYRNPLECSALRSVVTCDSPNGFLHQFHGSLQLEDGTPMPVNEKQLLLRGAKLRNTTAVWGLAVYTGHESKIIQNNQSVNSIKHSRIEGTMNAQLMSVFIVMGAACLLNATGCAIWTAEERSTNWYLYLGGKYEGDLSANWYGTTENVPVWFLAFFTSIALFSLMIPLSLYVTVEFIKLMLGQFVSWDVQMYSKRLDKYAKCRNENIIEDVGQINYLLSDKTGTLTMNQMALLKCSIGGVEYGNDTEQISGTTWVKPAQIPFYDRQVSNFKWLELPTEQSANVANFLTALSLCNSEVLPNKHSDGTIQYSAASPDDNALVKASHTLGVSLVSRSCRRDGIDQVELEVATPSGEPSTMTVNILKTIDFTNERKRMSVLVELPTGEIRLYSKGADNVMREMLADPNGDMVVTTQAQCDAFASLGLRVLLVAERANLSRKFVDSWLARYSAASTSGTRQQKEQLCHQLNEEMECKMELVGATAIEDKLQPGVDLTLTRLAKAGIKTWVLTGDKTETAVKISFACKLLTEEMITITMTSSDPQTKQPLGAEALMERLEWSFSRAPEHSKVALVVEGRAAEKLGIGLSEESWYGWAPEQQEHLKSMRCRFIELCGDCSAVVFCRVTPKQKGDLTLLVKGLGKVVAAIGDGANDVGMIQAANVGIGIIGVEGSQAVNNADFALAEFQHLAPLVLIHGRLAYKRLANSICYFFYKNFTAIFPVVCYVFYTGFSGAQLYDDTSIQAYNLIFTSLPILAFALLEQDVGRELALENPRVYFAGPEERYLNRHTFLVWMGEAALAACVVFVVLWAEAFLCLSPRGHEAGKAMLGILCYTSVLFIVTVRLAIQTVSWTWIHFVTYFLSVALWFVFLILEGISPDGILSSGALYWDIFYMLRWPGFYFTVFLSTAVATMPAFVIKVYNTAYQPSETELVRRELQKMDALEGAKCMGGDGRRVSRASDVFSNLTRSDAPTGGDQRDEPSAWKVIKGDETLTPNHKLRSVLHAQAFITRASASPRNSLRLKASGSSGSLVSGTSEGSVCEEMVAI